MKYKELAILATLNKQISCNVCIRRRCIYEGLSHLGFGQENKKTAALLLRTSDIAESKSKHYFAPKLIPLAITKYFIDGRITTTQP